MTARMRILYLAVLAAFFWMFLYVDSWLAAYGLVIVLAMPVLSLIVSLPAMLGCRVRVEGHHGQCCRGEENQWRITVYNTARLPLPRVKVRLTLHQALTGASLAKTKRYNRLPATLKDRLPMDTAHCGIWEAGVRWVQVYDALGLIAIRRRVTVTAQTAVLPRSVEPEPLPQAAQGQEQTTVQRPRRGGGMGEEYELRAYQPGDPVRMIHWKLSSKSEELILREVLERPEAVPVLTFDHLGPPDLLDGVLDRLWSLSNALLEQQKAHEIQWVHPENGQQFRFLLRGQGDLRRCFGVLLSQPAPTEGHRFPTGLRQTADWYYYHLEPVREDEP